MNRTSPVKADLPCSLEQMRRHATIGGSLPRTMAVALIARVEQLELFEELYRDAMRMHCPDALPALDVFLSAVPEIERIGR